MLMNAKDLTCVIITNGKKPKKTNRVIKSILHQKIPNFEILVSGIWKKGDGYRVINCKEGADSGNLAQMRNAACKEAQYENILLLDDDMFLSPNWYKNFSSYVSEFDILTSHVRLPDGTRFWDHCCYMSPTRGHSILEPDEDDDHLYMSGGQAWVMKKRVYEKVQWDQEKFTFYNMKSLKDYFDGKHNEDTDFSLRCRDSGFKIQHNHEMIAYHDDEKYTCVGRFVRERKDGRELNWLKELNWKNSPKEITQFAQALLNDNKEAECADVLRYGLKMHFYNFYLMNALENLYKNNLGLLKDCSEWSEGKDPRYKEAVKTYEN